MRYALYSAGFNSEASTYRMVRWSYARRTYFSPSSADTSFAGSPGM